MVRRNRRKAKANRPIAKQEIWVLSLGGSLIVPHKIDIEFLRRFRIFILRMVRKGHRFVIVCGGGALCRTYQRAAGDVVAVHPQDLDWIGIHVTRINAHLLRTIFRDVAHRKVVKDPNEPLDFLEDVLMVAGWKPGFSTDYDAVLLAERFGSKVVVNLTNVDYLYDRNPQEDKRAKPLSSVTWDDLLKITGTAWKPGLNSPFDPIASQEAARSGMTVVLTDGHDFENMEKILTGKRFHGTVVQ